jgi:hypothetical protein
MTLTEAVGWFGSALLVVSLLQTRLLRFRILNTVSCVVLVGFNAAIGVWPMVALNVVLCAINLVVIARYVRRRHDTRAYDAVPIGVDEPLLQHLLRRHAADIAQYHGQRPDEVIGAAEHAFVVSSGDELVGVVLSRSGDQPGEQVVLVDYVLAPYRDFTPGEFVYRPDGPFAALGTRRVVIPAEPAPSEKYLRAVGFVLDGDRWVLELAPSGAPSTA